MTEIPADILVSAYIKLRDKRSEIMRDFEAVDLELKTQQELVTEKLQEMLKAIGADNIKTKHGTVSRTVKTRYWTSDWGNMCEFIKENDAMYLMEQRLHQTNIKKYLEDNPDQLPIGLNSDSRYTVSVRKSK
tara:strand:- start:2548 stop:2943 length:396 start_codon:yes stop_codon:yes gene_type:complete